MKNIFAFLLFAGMLSFVSCKGDKTATADDASVAVATDANVGTDDIAIDPAAAATAEGAKNAGNGSTPAAGAAGEAAPVGPTTTIEFTETTFDFGTVKDGEKVKHSYKFKNTGKEPLIISNAKGSCGCTVPDWPREPIAPGKSGEIKVEFDSTGKGTPEGGDQTKKVTLTANTDPVQTYLTIKGIVKK